MGGAHSRRKGSTGEREAAKELSRLTGLTWRRGLNQARFGGKETADVVCEDLPGLHFEIKRGKRVDLWRALIQAISDAAVKGQLPVVMARKDHGYWVVALRLDDLDSFLGQFRAVPKLRVPLPPPPPEGR